MLAATRPSRHLIVPDKRVLSCKASSAGEMLRKAARRLEAQEQESAAQGNGSKKRLGEGSLSLITRDLPKLSALGAAKGSG